MSKKIILTGGGSAGHVTPNLALIEKLKAAQWDIHYIGTANGIEKQLIAPTGITYHTISTGKLRRYFSWQNFIDPFKLIYGVIKSTYFCLTIKPHIIFSKGGFVSLPVVIAGWLTRTPVLLHESDATPGLANKLSFPFAKKIFLTFADTARFFKDKNKLIISGTPIREQLFTGDKNKGLAFTQLSGDKPIILIMCGSLGSVLINKAIRETLPELLKQFSIIHLCGKNNIDPALKDEKDYRQYEYINKELADIFACSDLVISRSGANSLYELLALKKLAILIPLSKKASRGDQIDNAKFAAKHNLSLVLQEEELSKENLLQKINDAFTKQTEFKTALDAFKMQDSLTIIMQEINQLS